MTFYSGDMGDTSPPRRGHALEGVSRHGRACSLGGPPARGRDDGVLCEEFGISRKTGYKIFQRYQRVGVRGLSDRSRRPYRHANQLPMAVEKTIVRLKKEYLSTVSQ